MPERETDWFDLAANNTRRFSIYLPSKQKDGRGIEHFESLADTTLELLCSLFGGATGYPAKGVFQGADGPPQKEEIRMVECFCEIEAWNKHSHFLQVLVGVLARILNQETIGCALDGQIVFVNPVSWTPDPGAQHDANALKRVVKGLIGRAAEE